MKKCFILLVLLALSKNVKAEGTAGYTSDIVIAEGEDISLAPVLVAQNTLRNDGWFENCASGTEIRVYTDYLPNDDSITLNTKVLDVKNANTTPWTYKTIGEPETHSSLEWFYLCQQSDTSTAASSSDQYQKYIQYDTLQDTLTGNEYVSEQELSRVNALEYSNTYTANDSAGVQGARARAYNRALINNAVMLPNAGVMINNLHITITNSVGQVVGGSDTNLFITLTNLVDIVQGIQDELGFTNSGDTLKSLLDRFMTVQLTGWNSIWYQLQDIRDYTSNLTNTVDYTDWWKMLEGFHGSTNFESIVKFGNQYSYNYPNSVSDGFLARQQMRSLLGAEYSDAYRNYLKDLYNNVLKWDTSWLTLLASAFDREYYYNMGIDLQDFHRQTNIVNAVSLGRDWLNLATNDISSLPYWLNQQATGGNLLPGQTNSLNDSAYRFNLLTNQYAQISLTGSNPSNTAETWNYFKRLEMLLAALVYKEPSDGEKLSDDVASRDSVADEAKSEISNSLDTLLNSFSGSSNLLETHGQSLISALNNITDIFDRQWRPDIWRYYKEGQGEEPAAKGQGDSNFELYIDFSDSRWQYVFDFIRNICGFAWSLMSILLIYRFSILTYRLVMRFARICYSILRHMFG